MSEALSYETLQEELREQERKVAGWILYHEERKKELEQERNEILDTVIGAVRCSQEEKSITNKVNDVVADAVIKLDSIKKAKEIQLVEDVINMLPLEKKIFLQLRQKYNNGQGGRHKYNAYVKIQMEYASIISKLTGISEEEAWKDESTLKRWWREILNITIRLALKRNLL